ncbi:MAG: MFS transporter [Hyphomicrobiaceae bacterium]|nr:MFS transporter [Hyphomicrobiaceae bacterium]
MDTDGTAPRLPRRVIGALGLALLCSYGSLYYTVGALAPRVAETFGVDKPVIFAWFSASLLISGLLAPRMGRYIEAHGAGRILVAGALLSVAALATLALAPHPVVFGIGLIAGQLAGLCVFYDAAFAAMAEAEGEKARGSITELTLIAGFASTTYWPLTVFLADAFGWRAAFGTFAAIQLVLVLPLELYVTRQLGRAEGARPAMPQAALPEAPAPTPHLWLFPVLVGVVTLQGFQIAALHAHLIPVLGAIGAGAGLVWVSTLIGPSQVSARFAERAFQARIGPVALSILSSALMAAGLFFLSRVEHMGALATPLAVGFALFFGAGQGLSYIVRGVVPLMLFGRKGYAVRLGRLLRVNLAVSAVTPFLVSLSIERFGTTATLDALAVTGVFAVLLSAVMKRIA